MQADYFESEGYLEWVSRLSEGIKARYSDRAIRHDLPIVVELRGPQAVSFQSKGKGLEKRLVKEVLRAQTSAIPWLFVDDVEVEIEWHINDFDRYMGDKEPDVGNIEKLLVDAICGPEGIMIDDCQVLSISVVAYGGWVDGHNATVVRVKELPFSSGRIEKSELGFFEIKNGLYAPYRIKHEEFVPDFRAAFLAGLESGFSGFELEKVMPWQRPFHVSRLTEFLKLRPPLRP